MRLYVEPMDVVVVEVDDEGRVRFENEQEWIQPTLQERRATKEIEMLTELTDILERVGQRPA